MEVADIVKEKRQLLYTQSVRLSPYVTVTARQWEELESHNYLRVVVDESTREEDLQTFLAELLLRRKRTSLQAVLIRFLPEYSDPEKNMKLLRCLETALASTSRIYLKYFLVYHIVVK